MKTAHARIVRVEAGTVRPQGSWVYVWIDVDEHAIVYVGATAYDPELRAHIHLTNDDPDVGRVRAMIPRYDERTFDVLAFALPASVERSEVKASLLGGLRTRGLFDSDTEDAEISGLTAPILDAIEEHVRPGSPVPNAAST